jgi:hypothetical protein
MARYAYDVNTTQRYIDVHKQFQGGLKTVDTDDALGAVFLRQAENVSVSEFGFIEKRYGTYENFRMSIPGNLQGYWEFEGRIIYASEGNLYINGEKVTKVFQEFPEGRYPLLNDLADYKVESVIQPCKFVKQDGKKTVFSTNNPSTNPDKPGGEEVACILGNEYYQGCVASDVLISDTTVWSCDVYAAAIQEEYEIQQLFQKQREVSAININSVLYFFTGTYPLYLKDNFKLYLMPIEVPNYNEIVVLGHNLLENNYEQAYGFEEHTPLVQAPRPQFFLSEGFEIRRSDFYPKLPFAKQGNLNLEFDYRLAAKYANEFIPGEEDKDVFNIIRLKNLNYRYSGSGASILNAIPIDISTIDFEPITNYTGDTDQILQKEVPAILPASAYEPTFNENVRPTQLLYNKDGTIYKDIEGKVVVQGGYTNRYQTNFTLKRNYVKEEFIPGEFLNFKFYRETNENDGEISENPYKEISIKDMGKELIGLEQTAIYQTSNLLVTELDTYQKSIYITVTPVTLKGTRLENSQILVDTLEDGINIPFKIPSALSGENIESYDVEFSFDIIYGSKIVETGTIADLPNLGRNFPIDDLYVTVAKAESFSQNNTRFIGESAPPSLNFKIPSLIPGTFDFIAEFELTSFKYSQVDKTLEVTERVSAESYFGNITVTAEQLKDYERFKNPIWSCNQVIEHFGKLMVWGSQELTGALFYSVPDRPSYFPSYFYLDFTNNEGTPLVAVTPFMNILVAQTEDTTWGVRGNSGIIDSPAPYIPFSINTTVGAIARKSVRPVRNHLFFLSKQGVIALKSLYAADEQYNIDFVDRNIFNIVPRDIDAVGVQFDNQYWLNFPESGITLRWYIDKKAWVQDKFNAWTDFNGVFKWQVINGKLEFITYPSQFKIGENLFMYKIGVDYGLPTDLGQPIKSLFETSFLNQNYPFHPKNYKEAKLDFTLQNEYNAGRQAIYEMDTNEDIVGDFHTVQNSLLKNHRYRLEYLLPETDLVIIDGGVFASEPDEPIYDFGTYATTVFEATLNLKFYTIVEYIRFASTYLDLEEIDFETVEFTLPNNYNLQDLVIKGDFTGYNSGAYLRDVTYDDSLAFKTWVISEEQTLNIDNFQSYDPSLQNVNLDLSLKDRLGDWVFGESDFGNKVTAVKTIKLSGRGYNSKIYIEDLSKSKWTMESLGITYKMKRARSR